MGRSADKASLDRLVSAHLSATLRFAVRLTGDLDSAEDLTQEALLRAARNWRSFRGEADFRTWLFRIVINAFRDRLPACPAAEILDENLPDPGATDPASQALANELGGLIAARVSALPPRQREVTILVTYEGFSPQKVARLLGISEANVHATLHVARRRLRRELAAYLLER